MSLEIRAAIIRVKLLIIYRMKLDDFWGLKSGVDWLEKFRGGINLSKFGRCVVKWATIVSL